jgi:hypothetical protein
MVALFRALCERSESIGFSRDDLGLDPDFEPERKRCLEVVARNQVAAGIIVPRPFAPPRKDARFTLDDGTILL